MLSNCYAEAANRLKNLYITHQKLDETAKRNEFTICDTNVINSLKKK
jgi:hypothetical protein